MKIRKGDLTRLVRGDITLAEARRLSALLEAPEMQSPQSDPTTHKDDSLDAQVDKFLLDADAPSGDQPVQQESWLREADEDPAAAAPAPVPPAPTKKLDLVAFATDVARLVEKSDSLLDIKGTILRRALNFVSKNYDIKQSNDVAEILENNFGVSVNPSADPYEDEPVPAAKGAGPSVE